MIVASVYLPSVWGYCWCQCVDGCRVSIWMGNITDCVDVCYLYGVGVNVE